VVMVSRRPRFAASPWADDALPRLELESRLGPDHLARRIDQAVDRLDLSALRGRYGGVGSEAYRPERLLKAVLYEVRNGRPRPAQWRRDAHECEPVRWLLRGAEPSRSCWYAFRDRLAPHWEDWNRQVLAAAVAEGLTAADRGALDGTAVAADASRRRLVDEAKLRQRAEELDRAATADAGGAATADAGGAATADAGGAATADARAQAPPPRPGWMAPTPRGRRRQRRRLRRAQERMEALQQRNAAKRASKRAARQRVVVSVSDPEAAVGRDKEGVYRPLYNVQVVDDLDSPLVLGYEVFAQPNDAGTLEPMTRRLKEVFGCPVGVLLADSAYAGGPDLAAAQAAGVVLYAPPPQGAKEEKQIPKREFTWLPTEQTYQCPRGHRLEHAGSSRQQRSAPEAVELHQYRCPPEHCRVCPLRVRCTPNPDNGRTISRSEHEDLIEALRARMATPEAKALYRLRRQTVELVNADWKEHRQLRRFSGRGLTKARSQIGVTVLAHNLLTLLALENKAEKSSAVKPPGIAA
jgi:transposase